MNVNRLDVGRLSRARQLPAGGVAVPAFLTRTGVFEYRDAAGKVTRELRHPKHVFDAASLDTLAHAPVTDLHPPEMVTPANWKAHSIGSVAGQAQKKDDRLVTAELVVNDATAIKRIDAGERKEVSCGYTCDLIEQAGVFNGQKYDAVQTNIRYNHVALGPENWGRAGGEVALRLDSASFTVMPIDNPRDHARNDSKERTRMKKRFTVDGVSYEIECDETSSQALDKLIKRADAVSTLTAERDAEKQRADAAEANAKKGVDISAAVNARVELQQSAATVLGAGTKFDGKSNKDILVDVVKTKQPDLAFDKVSEDYLKGRFDSIVADAAKTKSTEGDPAIRKDCNETKTKTHNDRLDKAVEAHDKYINDSWRQPLTVTTQKAGV